MLMRFMLLVPAGSSEERGMLNCRQEFVGKAANTTVEPGMPAVPYCA